MSFFLLSHGFCVSLAPYATCAMSITVSFILPFSAPALSEFCMSGGTGSDAAQGHSLLLVHQAAVLWRHKFSLRRRSRCMLEWLWTHFQCVLNLPVASLLSLTLCSHLTGICIWGVRYWYTQHSRLGQSITCPSALLLFQRIWRGGLI